MPIVNDNELAALQNDNLGAKCDLCFAHRPDAALVEWMAQEYINKKFRRRIL